jgi:hypothetical protein
MIAQYGKYLRQERLESMKRFLGLAILILGLALSAGAQSNGRAFSGGSAPTSGGYGGGGGSIGGGGLSGVSFTTLPSRPPATFGSAAISGSDADFVPSTFLPFEKAVAAGQAMLDAEHASVADTARANSATPRMKARVALVEDAVGDPVMATIVYR